MGAISGGIGFAIGAAPGLALYLVMKSFADVGALFRRLAFLRWTIIGAVVGVVAGVALV